MPAAIGGAAAFIGPAIGAAGSIIGSAIQGGAAGGAASTQANAANSASAQELAMLQGSAQAVEPFVGTGQWANSLLANWLSPGGQGDFSSWGGHPTAPTPFSFDPNSINSNSTYQWMVQQGNQNTLNALSPQGGIGGNQLQALSQYNQGLAGQFEPQIYNQAFQTWQGNTNATQNFQNSIFNDLFGLSNAGQNAALGIAQQTTNVGDQIGANTIGAGNALAAGQIGQANALVGGLNNIGSNAQMYNQLSQNPALQGVGNNISNWFN